MNARLASCLVAVLAFACGGPPAPPVASDTREASRALPEEFITFERDYVAHGRRVAEALRERGREVSDADIPTSYRDIFISGSGIVIERKLVSTFAELDRRRADVDAAIDAVVRRTEADSFLGVVLHLHAEPAAVAVNALRLFAAKRKVTLLRIASGEAETMCFANITTQPSDPAAPRLSVMLDGERIWLGASDELVRIEGYQGRPDLERFHGELRRDSARQFIERDDVELSAEGASSSGHVVDVLGHLCGAGLQRITLRSRDQLMTRPP